MNPDKANITVTQILELLVKGQYDKVIDLDVGSYLTVADLCIAIHEYGRHLTMPPIVDIEQMSIVRVEGSKPKRWHVALDLWTIEEGRSDLTLELTLINSPGSYYLVELDNIHVL